MYTIKGSYALLRLITPWLTVMPNDICGRSKSIRHATLFPQKSCKTRNTKCQYDGRFWRRASDGQSRWSRPQRNLQTFDNGGCDLRWDASQHLRRVVNNLHMQKKKCRFFLCWFIYLSVDGICRKVLLANLVGPHPHNSLSGGGRLAKTPRGLLSQDFLSY